MPSNPEDFRAEQSNSKEATEPEDISRNMHIDPAGRPAGPKVFDPEAHQCPFNTIRERIKGEEDELAQHGLSLREANAMSQWAKEHFLDEFIEELKQEFNKRFPDFVILCDERFPDIVFTRKQSVQSAESAPAAPRVEGPTELTGENGLRKCFGVHWNENDLLCDACEEQDCRIFTEDKGQVRAKLAELRELQLVLSSHSIPVEPGQLRLTLDELHAARRGGLRTQVRLVNLVEALERAGLPTDPDELKAAAHVREQAASEIRSTMREKVAHAYQAIDDLAELWDVRRWDA